MPPPAITPRTPPSNIYIQFQSVLNLIIIYTIIEINPTDNIIACTFFLLSVYINIIEEIKNPMTKFVRNEIPDWLIFLIVFADCSIIPVFHDLDMISIERYVNIATIGK